MRWISCGALALSALLALIAAHCPADDPVVGPLVTSASVVKIKAKVCRTAPGKDEIVLTFDVDKPWHIYANPVGNESLESAQTTVKILSKDAAKVCVDYPAGKEREIQGTKWRSYEGTFEIRATVCRDAKATCPLEIEVRVQAVDDDSCLLPETIRVPLP
jgi:uncharacterized protein